MLATGRLPLLVSRLVVLGLTALGVLAVVPGGAAAGLGLAGPAAGGPSPAISSADKDFANGDQRDRARRQRLDSADARAQRTRSRTAHRSLDRDEALALARQRFPGQMTGRLFDGSEPAAGLRVVDQRGGGTALVQDTKTGKRALLQSTLPLQAKRPDGSLGPIDLSLLSTARGVGPTNSPAPFLIDPLSAAKVTFPGKGVSVSVRGDRHSVQLASDRAFFANVLTDTDVSVTPLPDGAEVSVLVRSAQAPERFVLDVQLPEGARVRQAIARDPIPGDPPQSLEIVLGKESLGYIHPPIAIDADGESVPATMRLDGQDIVLDVAHRDRDIRYPINVDPEVRLYHDISFGWQRWGWTQNRSGGGTFIAVANNCAYYCGLYEAVPTNQTLTNGSYAQWYYTAPINTYLYRTTFGGISHAPLNAFGRDHTRSYMGLLNGNGSGWENNVNYVNQAGVVGPNPYGPSSGAFYGLQHDFCFNPRCDPKPAAATEQNSAIFGLQAQNAFGGTSISSGSYKGITTMAWANVYLGDRRPPALTTAMPSSRDWTDEPAGTKHTVTPGVHDDGLGVYGIGLDGAASGGGFVRHGCLGDIVRSACEANWSTTFEYTLNEGINNLSVYGQDVVDNRTPAAPAGTWTEKIDRTPPELAPLQGTLWSARDRADDKRFQGLYDEVYSLKASSSDSHSGVREIEIYVDGQSERSRGGYAAGTTLDWTFRPDLYSDRTYTVEVVVRDNLAGSPGADDVRHVTRRSFDVTVDRRGDIYRATELSGNPAADGEAGAREALRLGTATSRSDDDGSVTTRSDVPCSDGGSTGALCAEWRSRSGEGLEEQDYTVYQGSSTDDIRVRDAAYVAGPRYLRTEDAASTGSPLSSVLEPWQVRPPAAGPGFEVHEHEETVSTGSDPGGGGEGGPDPAASETTVDVRLWLDSKTKLPVREETWGPEGDLLDRRYWSYDVSRLESDQVADDYFKVTAPSSPGVDERVEMRGDRGMAPQNDTETGQTIRPWNLGEQATGLLGQTLCLIDRHVVRVTELRGDDVSDLSGEDSSDPLAPMTIVGAAYNLVGLNETCDPGEGALDNPAVTVEVAHRDSTLGQLWRQDAVKEATDIQGDPTGNEFLLGGLLPVVVGAVPKVAYITTLADNTIAALLESDEDVVLIKGAITKLELPLVAALLRTS